MKTRLLKLLLGLSLAAGAYGLGWLSARPFTASHRRPSPGPPATVSTAPFGRAGAPDNAPKTLIDTKEQATHLAANRSALKGLLAKVLQLDPAGEDRQAEQILRDFPALLLSVPTEDYPAVWQWFCQLQSPDFRRRAGRALVTAWAKTNPRAALDAALTQPDLLSALNPFGPRLAHLPPFDPMDVIFSTWSEMSPQEALAAARAMPEDPPGMVLRMDSRSRSLFSVIHGLARTDPQYALELFEQLPPQVRSSPMCLVRDMALANPELAAKFVEKFIQPIPSREPGWDSNAQKGMLSDVASLWATLDAPKALAWAQDRSDAGERAAALECALDGMVQTSQAKEAFEFLASYPDTNFLYQPASVWCGSQGRARALARMWACQDLQGATAWLKELPPESPVRTALWDGIKSRWMEQDPSAALDFISASFSDKDAQKQLADTAADCGFLSTGLHERLPAGPAREAMLGAYVDKWIQQCPEESARLVAEMAPGREQNIKAVWVATEWANRDPSNAAAWAASFPDGQAREKTLPAVMAKWAAREPAAASQWLRTLPADSAQAKAAEVYVSNVMDKYPELAAHWAPSIADEQKRNQQLEKIARQWLQKDPQAARAWLEGFPSSAGQHP